MIAGCVPDYVTIGLVILAAIFTLALCRFVCRESHAQR